MIFIDRYAARLKILAFSAGKLITHEAMSGLSKVLHHLDKKNVHLLVVYIFMKIKPFLENVSFTTIIFKMVDSQHKHSQDGLVEQWLGQTARVQEAAVLLQ